MRHSLFLAAGLLAALIACTSAADTHTAAQPKSTPAALEGRGHIVPVQLVQVGSEVGGQVVEVFAEEGRLVKKGDVLARLDPTLHAIEVKRAEAGVVLARARLKELEAGPRAEEVQRAEAELKRAEAERDFLKAQVERLRRLKDNNAVSAEELARAENQLRAAENQAAKRRADLDALRRGPRKERVEAARAKVTSAEAQLDRARVLLDRTHIRSPIDGTVLKKNAEAGGFVVRGGLPLVSTLFEIADLMKLEADVPVSERDIGRIFVGQRCEVRTEAFPNDGFKGQVSRVLPVTDRARACFLVRVRIEVPANSKLCPEMSAVVRFLPKE